MSHGLNIAQTGEIVRINASAAIDAYTTHHNPTSLILCRPAGATDPCPLGGEILAFGPPTLVDNSPHSTRVTRTINASDAVILPGLVNAHTHLDLTHIGHIPHDRDGGFVGFVNAVRAGRHHDPQAIQHAVRLGIRQSLAGGTVAIGDILGAPRGDDPSTLIPAINELLASPLAGVIYLEYFDLSISTSDNKQAHETHAQPASPSFQRAEHILRTHAASLNDNNNSRLRLGIQPHAPYSVHETGYRRARTLAEQLGLRVATHLAESPEEQEFIASATGLQRSMLETLGVWHEALLAEFGQNQTPIQKFAKAWRRSDHSIHPPKPPPPPPPPVLAAHANNTSDTDLDLLKQLGVTIVYCPRSSAYFAAEQHFGPHRYQDMLNAGINVCLGTDSVLNLPPNHSTPNTNPGFGVLDEIRFLYQRNRTNPADLIAMGTTRGAQALGLPEQLFTWPTNPGTDLHHPIAGIVAVQYQPNGHHTATDPARAILESDSPPHLLFHGPTYQT